MTEYKGACCSTPAAMCYWFIVSVVAWVLAWGALSLIGIYWRAPNVSAAVAILFAMAIGCFANWLRNRSYHCMITGPLFLIAGIAFLLSDMHVTHASTLWVWPFVIMGVGIAFLLEWRYARRSAP